MPEVHAYVEVDEIARGIDFYTTGLDLHVARRLMPHWVELGGAQVPIHLLARPEGDFARHRTPVHLDFVVADLDAGIERAVAAGATLEGQVDHLGLWRHANLADPFGNGFDLVQFHAGGYAALAAVRPGGGAS